MRFRARHNATGGDGARADALAGSGGLLIGVSGAVAQSDAAATVNATLSGDVYAMPGR
ncbi:hypothetical protein LP419_39660 [Massilia sp. H-1]|nr:hypothetical protein LP419_39660 [Massilia sp. H-1]